MTVFRRLVLPTEAIRVATSPDYEHFGTPNLDGQRGSPCSLTAGLRQGCPLTPLLFAVAVDSLSRRTELCSPSTFARVHADLCGGFLDFPLFLNYSVFVGIASLLFDHLSFYNSKSEILLSDI